MYNTESLSYNTESFQAASKLLAALDSCKTVLQVLDGGVVKVLSPCSVPVSQKDDVKVINECHPGCRLAAEVGHGPTDYDSVHSQLLQLLLQRSVVKGIVPSNEMGEIAIKLFRMDLHLLLILYSYQECIMT